MQIVIGPSFQAGAVSGEVELGRFSSLRQELELEEKNVQSQDKKNKDQTPREKNVIKEHKHKAQRDKM